MSRNKYPQETVNLILDVSQKLFLEKGYEHTTVQDIINNLGGLTKGAIYHHFKSKEDILKAVTDRLFAENTLSAEWEDIKKDTSLNGSQKLKKMLWVSVTDGQEQEFRRMGIHIQNMPEMLSDLLLRSVQDIAPNGLMPVIEEGINDGSIPVSYAKELSEVISLIANVWFNPLVFPADDNQMKRKFDFLVSMMKMIGLDISDMYDDIDNMNKEINKNN